MVTIHFTISIVVVSAKPLSLLAVMSNVIYSKSCWIRKTFMAEWSPGPLWKPKRWDFNDDSEVLMREFVDKMSFFGNIILP